MSKTKYEFYSFVIISIIFMSIVPSIFGEVIEISTDSASYTPSDTIKFMGKVQQSDTGLVTIVIRDPNGEFVLLTQTVPDATNTFEKTIQANKKLLATGTYNVTGFILSMDDGASTSFTINNSILEKNQKNELTNATNSKTENGIQNNIEKVVDNFNSNWKFFRISESKPDFIDPTQDPNYYIKRYYNEPHYKSWFDRNYPGFTIEEAVGYNIENIQNMDDSAELIPEAKAIPDKVVDNTSDNETAQIILAISGIAILFGATYGIKRKVDDNARQISINQESIKKKIISPILRSDPQNILKTRLARGEITIDEYEEVKKRLEC